MRAMTLSELLALFTPQRCLPLVAIVMAACTAGEKSTVDSDNDRPAVYAGELGPNNYLEPANCLTIDDTGLFFDQVTAKDWQRWVNNYNYSLSPEYLATGNDGKRKYLRQRLVPSDIGSDRVSAGSDLEPARTYRLSQSLFFEPGFDWGGLHEGGKVGFGVGGGSRPSGGKVQTDGFTLRLMWRGNKDGTANLVAYSYAADRDQNLPWGDNYPLQGFKIPVGQWFEITLEVKANTTIQSADGGIRAWVNGELLLQKNNIRWQSSGDSPRVDKLSFATFYGGHSRDWAPAHTTFIRYADVCWSPVKSIRSKSQPDRSAFTPAMH